MDDATSAKPDTSNLSVGPALGPGEKGVHIIYVPVDVIVREMNLDGLGGGPVGAVTLAQVAKHIGKPAMTDVIVFAGKPWHFAGGALREHPKVHEDYPETVLKLFRKRKEKAVWWSEHAFEIFKIVPHPPKRDGAADYPFSDKPTTVTEVASDHKTIFIARSTIPIQDADDQEYKIAFHMEGENIDPNMYCDGN